jgi:uncharacterized protein YjbI with pentapeptide repeats
MQNSFDGADFRGAQFKNTKLMDFTARWAEFSAPVWKPHTQKLGILPPYVYTEHPEWLAYAKPPVDFSHAHMGRVNFEGSNLTGAKFVNVTTLPSRETVPASKPMDVPYSVKRNEIPASATPWINPYTEACPPVNLKDTNLNDTVLNRSVHKQNGTLEPAFNFEGANLEGADFSKATIKLPYTPVETSVADAIRNIAQAEAHGITNNPLKQQLIDIFGKVGSVDEKTTFSKNKELNKEFLKKVKDRIERDDKDKPELNPFKQLISRIGKKSSSES